MQLKRHKRIENEIFENFTQISCKTLPKYTIEVQLLTRVFYCYVFYAILYNSSDVAMIMFLVFHAPIQLFAYSFPILLVPWTFFYAVAIYFAIDIISEHTSNLLDGVTWLERDIYGRDHFWWGSLLGVQEQFKGCNDVDKSCLKGYHKTVRKGESLKSTLHFLEFS